MKRGWMLFYLVVTMTLILACSFASAATPSPTGEQPVGPTEPTLPPLAPETVFPTAQRLTAVPTRNIRITATASPTATLTLAATTPTATMPPVSTGPLDFTVSIIGCQLDPSREGGVILKMRFDPKGGNGVYTYYRDNQRVQRIFDRPATKGTAVIESYRVESGDGQRVERKERFTGQQFGCQ